MLTTVVGANIQTSSSGNVPLFSALSSSLLLLFPTDGICIKDGKEIVGGVEAVLHAIHWRRAGRQAGINACMHACLHAC